MQFTDVRNQPAWLNLTKRLNQHEVKKEVIQKFAFKFKYFPENVADEVIQDVTLKHLYLQVRIQYQMLIVRQVLGRSRHQ